MKQWLLTEMLMLVRILEILHSRLLEQTNWFEAEELMVPK